MDFIGRDQDSSMQEDMRLREKLSQAKTLQNNLDYVRSGFKKLIKTAKNMKKSFSEYHQSALDFAEQLQAWSFNSFYTERDPILNKCGSILVKLQKNHMDLMEQIQLSVIDPIRKFMQEEINSEYLKGLHRDTLDASQNYDALLRKPLKKAKLDPGKLEKEATEAKQQFSHKCAEYVNKLSEVQTISRFNTVQHICVLMFSMLSYYHQGYTWITEIKSEVNDVLQATEKAKIDFLENKDSISKSIDLTKGEKQGYLLKKRKTVTGYKSWSLKWVKLDPECGKLQWYKSFKDSTKFDRILLLLCSIKPMRGQDKEPFCFEVINIERRIVFKALNEVEYSEWMEAITSAISSAVGRGMGSNQIEPVPRSIIPHTDIIRTLRELDGNKNCVDCRIEDPQWASINIGALMCIECSGVHRSFGTHISKIRSLEMDSLKPEQYEFMKRMGNTKVNAIYEHSLTPDHPKLSPNSSRNEKERFITAKYKDKTFIPPCDTPDLAKSLFNAVKETDLTNIIRYLAQGANINWQNPNDNNKSLVHYTTMTNNVLVLDVLLSNSADINVKDAEGKTPLHYAVEKSIHTVKYLLSKHADVTIKDSESKTALIIAKQNQDLSGSKQIIEMLEEAESMKASKNVLNSSVAVSKRPLRERGPPKKPPRPTGPPLRQDAQFATRNRSDTEIRHSHYPNGSADVHRESPLRRMNFKTDYSENMKRRRSNSFSGISDKLISPSAKISNTGLNFSSVNNPKPIDRTKTPSRPVQSSNREAPRQHHNDAHRLHKSHRHRHHHRSHYMNSSSKPSSRPTTSNKRSPRIPSSKQSSEKSTEIDDINFYIDEDSLDGSDSSFSSRGKDRDKDQNYY